MFCLQLLKNCVLLNNPKQHNMGLVDPISIYVSVPISVPEPVPLHPNTTHFAQAQMQEQNVKTKTQNKPTTTKPTIQMQTMQTMQTIQTIQTTTGFTERFYRDVFPPVNQRAFEPFDFACILNPVFVSLEDTNFERANNVPENPFAQACVLSAVFLHGIVASALAWVVALPALLFTAVYAIPFEIAFAFVGTFAFASCPAYSPSLRFLGSLFVFSTSLLAVPVTILGAVVCSPFFALVCGFQAVVNLGWSSWRPVFGLHAPVLALGGWINVSAPAMLLSDAWTHWREPCRPNEAVRDIQVVAWIEAIALAIFGGLLGIVAFVGVALVFCVPLWLRAIAYAIQLPRLSLGYLLIWIPVLALVVVLVFPAIVLSASVVYGFCSGAWCWGESVFDNEPKLWTRFETTLKDFKNMINEFAMGSWNIRCVFC
jgi:hypothetical protein